MQKTFKDCLTAINILSCQPSKIFLYTHKSLLTVLQNSWQHIMYYCIPCPSSWQTDSSPRRSRPACPDPRGGSVGSCTGSPCWLSPPVPSCRRGRNKTVSATSSDLSEKRSQTRTILKRLQNCSSTGKFELTCCGATIYYIQKIAIYYAQKVYTVQALLLVTLFYICPVNLAAGLKKLRWTTWELQCLP